MADISKVQVGSTVYSVKDGTARKAAADAQATANNKAGIINISTYASSGQVMPSFRDVVIRNEAAVVPVVFSNLPSSVGVLQANTTYIMYRFEYMVSVGKYWKYYIFNYNTKAFVVEYSNATVPDVIANIP